MPNSNNNTTSSPVKRPGLGRRAVSSHAVVTRSNSSTSGDLSDPHASTGSHSQKPHVFRSHHHPRPHLVGHRHQNHHHRNPSFGKNVNKLQRLASGITETGRNHNHQRKKSAPATPAASPPRGGHHVHWGGETEDSHPGHSMKKNNSSPALRRLHAPGGGAGKKAAHPGLSSGKKKTVGFELGDSDNDDGEWEDTAQSPESTRRSSVAQTKESAENATTLVDPLVFVKRPYPQIPRATSLPEPTSQTFAQEGQSTDEEEGRQQEQLREQQQEKEGQQKQSSSQSQSQSQQEESQKHQETSHAPESSAIASRLLSPSLPAKAPPAMSSISAMAKPTATDDAMLPNTSMSTLASSQGGSRRPLSSSNPLANTPGNQTQATSSSIEGGVSRFIVSNKAGNEPSPRTDSDPNTPSSFLPHYHPSTPPSPGRAPNTQKPRASPPTRPPGLEPPSRTQQKLWLQRTAALNTSPPDSHASTNVSPSAMDPAFMAAARPGSGLYDTRGLVNGAARAGGAGHDSEAKQTRKAYEKTALELDVVQRFQSPTADSFNRLRSFIHESKAHERRASISKAVHSAPSLPLLRDGKQSDRRQSDDTATPEPRQLIGRRIPDSSTPSVSQAYLQEGDDSSANVSDSGDQGQRRNSQHPSQRILSTSDETVQENPSADDEDTESNEYPNESEMMIRRMWESRVVASSA